MRIKVRETHKIKKRNIYGNQNAYWPTRSKCYGYINPMRVLYN
ncbi:hypothetical protein [Helicobacter pylori]